MPLNALSKPRTTLYNNKRALTLVELLVAFAMLSMLVAFGGPVLMSARHRMNKTTCLNNMKQIGSATYTYAQVNQGYIPPTEGTHEVYHPEVGLTGNGLLLDGGYIYPAELICPAVAPEHASSAMPSSGEEIYNSLGKGVVGGHYNTRAINPFTSRPTWGETPMRLDRRGGVAIVSDLFGSPYIRASFPTLFNSLGESFTWWAAPRTPVRLPAGGLQHDTTGASTLYNDGSAVFVYWQVGLHYNWQSADVEGGGWWNLDIAAMR